MNTVGSVQDTSELDWCKSSYSGGEGGECLEMATNRATIHVRDSKASAGPQLTFSAAEWTAFVAYASAAH